MSKITRTGCLGRHIPDTPLPGRFCYCQFSVVTWTTDSAFVMTVHAIQAPDMGEMSIRRAVLADLAAVVALLADADQLHRDALPWLFRQIEGPALTGFLEPYVLQSDRVMFLACAPDRSLAGVIYMFLRQPARAPIVQPTLVAEIDSLVVHPSFRRQHVGTRLVEAALGWAADSGAARTELGVYEFNQTARAFWHSVGFETLSRRLVLHSRPET